VTHDKQTLFYSWQSDTPAALNRSFIEETLTAAIKRIKSEAVVEPAIRNTELVLDKDTEGVPGSPPIAQTILAKIDQCSVFVADLTFVGSSLSDLGSRQRLFPNPNVLIEYGYGLCRHGHDRMISILNTAFGESHTDNLPFDLRHLRWPITYHLSEDTKRRKKDAAFEALVVSLSEAIKLVLSAGSVTSAATENDFKPQASTSDPSIFFTNPTDLIPDLPFRKLEPFQVPDEGRAYLRVYPVKAVEPFATELDARTIASRGTLAPMGIELTGWDHIRNVFGAVAVEGPIKGKLYRFTQLFLSRELWGLDALAVNATRCREFMQGETGGFIMSLYGSAGLHRDAFELLTVRATFLGTAAAVANRSGINRGKGLSDRNRKWNNGTRASGHDSLERSHTLLRCTTRGCPAPIL